MSKLALGTAQMGLSYGVANQRGQVSPSERHRILEKARGAGISMLDTAIVYGESESSLGAFGVEDFQIVTKLPLMPDGCANVAEWVEDHIKGSLARLRRNSVHGLLLHCPAQLCGPRGIALYQALLDQRERGRVCKIGISIYDPEELDALPASMRFDIVQAPFNVLDMRMVLSGWASRLIEVGTEFHARSIFLQGLLLMPASKRPAIFTRWNPLLTIWDRWLAENRLTALEACIRHALYTPEISHIIIGVDSAEHLSCVVTATSGERPALLPAEFANVDAALINPSSWSKL